MEKLNNGVCDEFETLIEVTSRKGLKTGRETFPDHFFP